MSFDPIIASVQFGLGLCVLLVIYKYVYQKTRLDRLREDLFTMRDDLFDYVWKHNLSYDNPAYRRMRDMLNGFILVAHRFNVSGFLIGVSLSHENSRGEDLKIQINNVSDEKFKEYLQQLYVMIGFRVLHFIFLEGPLWIIFKPLGLAARHLPSLRRWCHKQFATIAAAAANFGSPDIKSHRLGDAATIY